MELSEFASWQDAHGMDEYQFYISRREQFRKRLALKRGKLLVSILFSFLYIVGCMLTAFYNYFLCMFSEFVVHCMHVSNMLI